MHDFGALVIRYAVRYQYFARGKSYNCHLAWYLKSALFLFMISIEIIKGVNVGAFGGRVRMVCISTSLIPKGMNCSLNGIDIKVIIVVKLRNYTCIHKEIKKSKK